MDALRKLLGYPAETIVDVGAYDGRYSLRIRGLWPTADIYLVDPWQPMSLFRTYSIDNSPAKWARIQALCQARFAHDNKAHILKETSEAASRRFAPQSVDVVNLDAGREYSLMQTYFSQWLPKLRPGGILMGKGLAGRMRGDVWLALKDRFGQWERIGRTVWAVKC